MQGGRAERRRLRLRFDRFDGLADYGPIELADFGPIVKLAQSRFTLYPSPQSSLTLYPSPWRHFRDWSLF